MLDVSRHIAEPQTAITRSIPAGVFSLAPLNLLATSIVPICAGDFRAQCLANVAGAIILRPGRRCAYDPHPPHPRAFAEPHAIG